MRLLEGVRVTLWSGTTVAGALTRRARGSATASRRPLALTALVTFALLTACASPAQASEAQAIIEKCGHGEPFSGYSQNAYREALKQMPTEVSEYSDCVNLIRKAELAAAGGGTGGSAGTASSNVALPLTPFEQRAVESAHRNGSTPVRVGNQPIRPGVVHADIASAVNTLPHSLFAVLAFLLAGALALAVEEVRKRVRARRDG
ncbi:MAG TPA: hypothetical protein VFV03_02950 [Solirubrobacteraceae bacterium]|nr:hypothetical protein [Solirubrobacteraceae bacterium]